MELGRQKRAEWRELDELAGERIEHAEGGGAGRLAGKNKEALRGKGEQLVVAELRYVNLDTLASGCVEE